MNDIAVNMVAELSFARGKVGQRFPLVDEQARTDFAAELGQQTVEITKANTADCGDERLTIGFADGTTDEETIRQRITPQLFGGIGLSATKALVAANAAIVQDAKDMWDAYLKVSDLLSKLGYEDAGHKGCGASQSVKGSVENAIEMSLLVPSVGLLVGESDTNKDIVEANMKNKQTRLENGFYDKWSNSEHEAYLIEKYPQNFAYLLEDPTDLETKGHNGSGLYAITQPGHGFSKNGKAFSVTLPMMTELAYKLGGTDEERRRILIGFADDTLHVGAGIVTSGFPAFAETA